MLQKKHRLFIEETSEFTLFGIIGSIKAVTLAWHINQILDIELELKGSVKIDNTKKALSSAHPFFSYYDELDMVSYHLFLNKDGKHRLMPELDKMDFLLKIEDQNEQVHLDNFLSKFKEIQSINFVLEIDPNKLKNQENLIPE